jgi:hypothetical protein
MLFGFGMLWLNEMVVMMKNVENCSENGNVNFGCDGTMR